MSYGIAYRSGEAIVDHQSLEQLNVELAAIILAMQRGLGLVLRTDRELHCRWHARIDVRCAPSDALDG